MTALRLKGVNKTYGTNRVLRDIDLTFEDDEFIVVVGPSGCGKTTLLRVVAGLEMPDSGTIEINGRDMSQVAPGNRNVAMVFQSYALYPHLTVRENFAFALQLAGFTHAQIDERIKEVSSILSLEEYLERKPSALSGGQRQRVALGRALVRKPSLFLFDEPLSNLDAALRMNTRIEIANIHRTLGTCFIYVTHDQTEAMTLADRIVVMRAGLIEQIGKPLELYNHPVNKFVAGFLGSPAMNFFDAADLNIKDAVTVGLRPEHIYLAETDTECRLSGTVMYFERLGTDTHVIVDMGNNEKLTVRLVGQHEFEIGSTIKFDFDDHKAVYFDAQDKRIDRTVS